MSRRHRTFPERVAIVALLLVLLALPAVAIYAYVAGPSAEVGALDQVTVAPPPASLQEIDALLDEAERKSKRGTRTRKAVAAPVYEPKAQVGFVWPVAGRITSPYGERILQGNKEFHHGMDVACGIGYPVRAAAPGYVVAAGQTPVYGNVVLVQHANGWQTLYAHLSEITATPSSTVQAGGSIGKCGDSGRATGPHLHFEIRYGGYVYDPALYLP